MFVHLLKTTLEKQRKAHEEATQLKNTTNLTGELQLNGQPVGEETQSLLLQVINLLADNCALEIEGIPENIHWTVAKNMLATAKLNVNRQDILGWVKEGELKKVHIPWNDNPHHLFLTRDSVERLMVRLRKDAEDRWHELWDMEHKLGITE